MDIKIKKRIILALIGMSLLLPAVFIIYAGLQDAPSVPPPPPEKPLTAISDAPPVPEPAAPPPRPIRPVSRQAVKPAPAPEIEKNTFEDIVVEEEPPYHPKNIDEIKKQIYDLGIEYVEDIELLDQVVQTGDTDARELWGGDWKSADDWKAEENGFELEQNADGTYTFTPDEVTQRSYSFYETPGSFSYDQDRNEFNWDVDYYGKTITNKFKFINEETAVLMIISGHKVTTNIYRKAPPAEGE